MPVHNGRQSHYGEIYLSYWSCLAMKVGFSSRIPELSQWHLLICEKFGLWCAICAHRIIGLFFLNPKNISSRWRSVTHILTPFFNTENNSVPGVQISWWLSLADDGLLLSDPNPCRRFSLLVDKACCHNPCTEKVQGLLWVFYIKTDESFSRILSCSLLTIIPPPPPPLLSKGSTKITNLVINRV
jgi:hypothetical protein